MNLNLDHFTLDVYKSREEPLAFAIVSHEGTDTKLIEIYRKFQLAHMIRNPVIIFQMKEMELCSAPLFNSSPYTPSLYHIPVSNYKDLEYAVSDDPFLVSDKALEILEGTSGLMGNIFTSLEALNRKHGLIVVGIEVGDVS